MPRNHPAAAPALPQTFEDLLVVYQDDLTREVLRRMPPLYTLDGAPQDPEIDRLLRRPFHVQYHAAKALATYLEDHTGALLVGRPSSGKTITALATAALLRVTRALVVAPTHLLPKWRREIQTTVPGAVVLDLRRVRDIDRALTLRHSQTQPVFLLLSRDQGKLGAPWRHVATQQYLSRHDPKSLMLPRRIPLVQGAEALPYLAADEDGAPLLAFSCPRCGELLRDEPTPDRRKLGRERHVWTAADFGASPRHCPFCREPLFQQHRVTGARRGIYPLGRYLARRYPGSCDLVLVDEVHRLHARGTAQGMMLSDLGKIAPKAVALTATLMNGRASSLFYLLHRLSPEFRRRWAYRDVGRFARTFGLHEVTHYADLDEERVAAHGKRTKATTIRTQVRELPGVSPSLLQYVLDRTVIFHLRDLGIALPPYREQAVEVPLSSAQHEAYQQFFDDLQGHIAHGYRRRMLRFLGLSLQALLAWPDAPWRGDAVTHPTTGEILASLPALPETDVYPKEAVLRTLCQEARSAGRRVLVYCTHTQTRDITHRLQRLLTDAGLRTQILTSGVASRRREAWIERHAPSLDVLLTHPKLVGEGLDLIQFADVLWMEPEYSTYTVRQASLRTWRIGQTQPVTVRFLVYRDTVQTQTLSLVAKGIRAASMVDGEVLVDDTLAEYGQSEFFLELARLIAERTSVPDLDTLFRQAEAQMASDHTLILPSASDRAAPEAPRIRDIALTHRPEQLALF